jgi:hypothetical protein
MPTAAAAAPARGHAAGAALARHQATPAALLELHTLQALDATLAGASLRDGRRAVRRRCRRRLVQRRRPALPVRRLVRRGDALMRGGYRRLAQLPPLEKGRFEATQNVPEQGSLVF